MSSGRRAGHRPSRGERCHKLVRDVHTGIAAEALGWLAPRRLVAGLQRGGTVLVDPVTGRIRRRWPSFSFPDESARLPDALVMLLPPLRTSSPNLPLTRVAGAPRPAVVDREGRLRCVTLKRIRLDARFANGVYYEDRAGLAVDPARARAYVFAADAPITEVDLRTMRVSYHRELAGPEIEGKNRSCPATACALAWRRKDRRLRTRSQRRKGQARRHPGRRDADRHRRLECVHA
jgi:hypothetical protein